MSNRDWNKWWKCAGTRAVKTMAQAAIAGVGTATAMGQADWYYVISASILSGAVSILMSLAGLPEEKGEL